MESPDQPTQLVHVVHHQDAAAAHRRKTSGLAVTSLVMGIVSLVGGGCLIVPPVLAVIFGHIAVSACKKNPLLDGKGMGIAGLVMGWLCVAGMFALIIFYGGLFALMAALQGHK
jgi:uncharacterized protein DUF4190